MTNFNRSQILFYLAENLEIEASGVLEWNQENNSYIADGNAIASQGARSIKADKITGDFVKVYDQFQRIDYRQMPLSYKLPEKDKNRDYYEIIEKSSSYFFNITVQRTIKFDLSIILPNVNPEL